MIKSMAELSKIKIAEQERRETRKAELNDDNDSDDDDYY